MMVSLIVAYDKNFLIGNNGKIPWDIPGEQTRFKNLTTGNVVIMGRKTFEEIFNKLGKGLPNRENIIISTTKNFECENCYTVKSFKEAIEFSEKNFPGKDIFISGGKAVYEEAIPVVEKMYVTEIDNVYYGDTFFPVFIESNFNKEIVEKKQGDVNYQYVTYTKK